MSRMKDLFGDTPVDFGTAPPKTFDQSAEGDICANKHGGGDTSIEAFEKTKFRRNENHKLIMAAVEAAEGGLPETDGLTTEEIEARTGLQRSTCSARVSELKRHLFLIPSGRKRLTASNCNAHVLIRNPQLTEESK